MDFEKVLADYDFSELDGATMGNMYDLVVGEVEKSLNLLDSNEKKSPKFNRIQSLNQLYQRNNIVAKTIFSKYCYCINRYNDARY